VDLSRPMSVVTPTVDGDVLTALALADAWFTTGRLHGVMGRHSEDGIRRVLRRLVQQGIVEDQAAGNAVLYRLNRAHLAAPAVIELAGLWSAFVDRLTVAVSAWPVQPKVAAVFGSAARGTMHRSSDIDVFLVEPTRQHRSDEWVSRVRQLEDDASRWTGNDVRALQMTEAHVRAHAGDEPVLDDVLADGVHLAGDLAWLRRLVKRASSVTTGV
jgi:predicted nucleotidyltransferase